MLASRCVTRAQTRNPAQTRIISPFFSSSLLFRGSHFVALCFLVDDIRGQPWCRLKYPELASYSKMAHA